MSGAVCRAGHVSDEPDYCSVCGVAMTAARAPVPPPLPPGRNTPLPASVKRGLPSTCPECSEPRAEADARFCEVCRFDFVAGKPGPPPAGAAPKAASVPSPPPAASPAVAAPPVAVQFELVVTVDPTLDTEPDPESPCPKDVPAIVVPIDKPELLLGRRDDRRDIHPDLPIQDPGTSRRHAKLLREADGSIALLDLASTNGTKLNGVEVASGSRTALKAGDEVTLGRWTRISLRSRP